MSSSKKPAKRPAGRPGYKPAPGTSLKIRALRADGREQKDIAAALGISEDTLQRHHREDLDIGGLTLRADIIAKQAGKALKGDTAAARLFLSMTAKGDAADRARVASEGLFTDPEPVKKPKLGKKEQALENAADAGTGTNWGSDLNPVIPPTVN